MRKIFIKGFMAATAISTILTTQSMVSYARVNADQTYTVESGDDLKLIAKDILGDEDRWTELYDLNSSTIKDPALIYPGQILILPNEFVVAGEGTQASATGSQTTKPSETSGSKTTQSSESTNSQNAQPSEPAGSQTSDQAPAARDEEALASKLAKELIEKAKLIEPMVTSCLQEMESDNVKLIGLEHRLKSQESLAEIIITKSHELNISTEEAANDIGNVLRYTLCTTTDNYLNMVDSTLKKLTSEGITEKSFNNTWGDSSYKGINTTLQANDIVIELQFHTNESYNAKEATLELYEKIHAENTPQEEKDRLQVIHDAEYENIPIPEGAPDYKWNN